MWNRKKREKLAKEKIDEIVKLKFHNTLNMATNILERNTNIPLDSNDHPIYHLINVFALSLQAKWLQEVITANEHKAKIIGNMFIPDYKHFKFHNIPFELYEEVEKERIEIDFSKNIVISNPWNRTRFENILFDLANEEWEYDELNHRAEYYEPLKITIVRNGMHSSAAGILKRQGKLPAQELSINCFYKWIKTDGVNFYKMEDDTLICEVPSFEEAVLFEIGRLIVNKAEI